MQTAVAAAMTIGIVGQIADLQSLMTGDVVSKFSEEASAEIPFGVMLGAGTADDGAKLLAATSDNLIGISVFHHGYAAGVEVGTTGPKPDVSIAVLNVGRAYVLVEEAVTPSSAVRVRAVAAGAELKGAFRTTADGTDTIDISAFARYMTSADAAGIAMVEIDMRNANLAVADT